MVGAHPPEPWTPPIPLNVGAVREMLHRRVGFEEMGPGADAVLLHVVVDADGRVQRARVLRPRIAGLFVRRMPAVYDGEGRPVEPVRWSDDPLVRMAAVEVARSLQFAPARHGGVDIGGSCRIVLRARSGSRT